MKDLQVRNLNYGKILNGVNFDWHQGEIIALMGANGSGKSSLARLLAGLLEPTVGEIQLNVDGIPQAWNTVRRWQEIGLVGQHPRRQTIGATVAEELGYGLLNLGCDIQWVRKKVRELAFSVGLGGKENQSPATLSGGERQRLVTVAILALQPSFLILDEALTMLDARAQANIQELLFQAQTETGQLWITHDQELARLADRLLVIQNGKILDVRRRNIKGQLEDCTPKKSWRTFFKLAFDISSPHTKNCPSVGRINPMALSKSVVFPEPEGPIIPINSPALTTLLSDKRDSYLVCFHSRTVRLSFSSLIPCSPWS